MNDKKRAQRLHATRRAAERYGINWNRHRVREVKAQIALGRATLLEKQSNRVSIYQCWIEGRWIKIAYDKQRKEVASVLPLEDKEDDEGQT